LLGQAAKLPRVPLSYDMLPGVKKSGFFNRGRLGAGLGSTVFLAAGLAAVFFPVVFAPFALAVDATTLGFRGITVNSSSFPQ
jgi:hypothetical protein